MSTSEQSNASEHEKTAALHEIAEEVEHDREVKGHSLLDGENVIGNREGASEGHEDSTLASEVQSIPPAMPSGN
ncbi:hypothetical protein [Demequina aurantiaca]|uniref:hypothetical protein n=1 Tax=Demequina aurantiaca TaxID=676200 RepID=UPI003D332119